MNVSELIELLQQLPADVEIRLDAAASADTSKVCPALMGWRTWPMHDRLNRRPVYLTAYPWNGKASS